MTSWNWLEEQQKLQVEAYGKDPAALEGDVRADYWTEMMYALDDEVHEFGNEVNWKTWSNNRGTVINRDAALGELVDVAFFLGNLILTLGASDEEFWNRYREKVERNRARQMTSGGYDAKKSKCPTCQRELDKVGAYRMLHVVIGSGAGTQEDLNSDKKTFTLSCNMCRVSFPYVTQGEEPLP